MKELDACLGLFRAKAKVSTGADIAGISQAEEVLELSFPTLLKEILKVTDGVVDSKGNSLLWSTSQILSKNQFLRTDSTVRQKYMPLNRFLFFSDAPCNGCFGFAIVPDSKLTASIFHWKGVNDSRESVSYHLSRFYEDLLDDREWLKRRSDPGGWEMSTAGLEALKPKIEKYWTTFPPVSESEIQAVEAQLGLILPDDLRQIYLYSNGIDSEYGQAVYKLQELVPENALIKAQQFESDWVMPADSFLFFAPEGNGDYYAFPITEAGVGKAVMELEHEDDSRSYAAPDIFNLLDYQLEEYDEY